MASENTESTNKDNELNELINLLENENDDDLEELINIIKEDDKNNSAYESLNEIEENSNNEVEELINLLNSSEDDIINIDLTPTNDISSYSTSSNGNSDEENKIPAPDTLNTASDSDFEDINTTNNTEKDKKNFLIYSIIGFLSILIIMTILFFTITIKKINSNNLKEAIKKDEIIAKYVPEEENILYLDLSNKIDDTFVILEKVEFDQLYTTFNIKSTINPNNYNIKLTDEKDTLYPMDKNFININKDEIKLRFAPIEKKVAEIIMSFENIKTGEKILFKFDNNFKIVGKPVKYINDKIENKLEDFQIDITSGTFSSSNTSINYAIINNSNKKYKIRQGFLDDTDYITLTENDVEIERIKSIPYVFPINENIDLGRIDFDNVSSVNDNLVLTFDKLYKEYKVDKTLSLQQIKDAKQNGGVNLKVDKYNIFIEGIPRFDDTFVLVFSGKDTTISNENNQPKYNFAEILLDAELILETSSGTEIILEPKKAKSANYGTDTIFKLEKSHLSYLNNLTNNNIKVKIKSLLIKTEPVYISVNLSRTMNRKIISDIMMEKNISNSFESRLNYKYKKSSLSSITGFKDSVLNNERLKEDYTPVNNVKSPKYSINIISKMLINDKLYALVQEVSDYQLNNKNITSYTNHKIEASYIDENWIITSDEIIH